MSRRFDLRKQCGNSVLEMLLCTPLALLFLFVVTDTGLSLIDGAALKDAVRTGIAAQAAVGRELPLVRLGADGEFLAMAQSELETSGRELADAVEQAVLRTKRNSVGDTRVPISIDVTPVTVEIDAATGKLDLGSLRAANSVGSRSSAPVSVCDAELPPLAFAQSQLQAEQGKAPSRYATPSGFNVGTGAPQVAYLPQAVFFAVSVRVQPSGVNPKYSNNALGRVRALCEQQLTEVRNAVH